ASGLPSESLDVVFCDHGAMSFAEPARTIPEVSRLLRPGGLLAFCTHTPIVELAWAEGEEHPGERLVVDYWEGLRVCDEPGEPVSFQLPYGEWIRLFGENGLLVEDLLELRPPADAQSTYRTAGDRDWARRWPMEHIWRVRRAAR
ncbi:MAG TPA: methyltransferase domain-containing protein, partial [Solirubrobacteraceae bacterium]